MKKKIIALLLLVVLVFTVGIACAACDWGDQMEIVFYHTMNKTLQNVLDKYIAKFEAMYPGIKIKHTQVGGYPDVRDQVVKDLQIGEQPNIAYCYPDHVALFNISRGVMTLDSFINSTEKVEAGRFGNEEAYDIGLTADQIADFMPGYYNEGKSFGDGLMYTLPFSKSTEVLYYNKTFFEEHNLKVPDHWYAADDNDDTSMEYVMKAIKQIDPNSIPLGYDSDANFFITMTEQLGTGYTTSAGDDNYIFDNAENQAMVKKLNEWYKNKWLITGGTYEGGNYTSALFTVTKASDTKCYMVVGSSAGATNQRPDQVNGVYPFEVGITPIPQHDANNPKVISQGPSVCILKQKNPEEVLASWLFVKYLTTNVQFQAEFSMASGYVPVLKSVGEDPTYAQHVSGANGTVGITALSAQVCLQQADYYYTSDAFVGSAEARDQVDDMLIKCLNLTSTGSTLDNEIATIFANAINKLKH